MITRKVSMRAVASLAAAFVMLVAVAAPVAGRETDSRYYSRVEARIGTLQRAGATPSQIDAMLRSEFGWARAGVLQLRTATSSPAAAAAAPFVPSASDVRFNAPTTYWNTPLLRWEVRGTWQWKDCSTEERCWAWYPGYLGNGQDAFGIHFSRTVNRIATSLTVFDERNRGRFYSVPESFNSYGATFSEFDTYNSFPSGYLWDHGSIYMSLTLPSGACVRGHAILIDTKMGHTWTNTGVSGITVGSGGINVTFSETTSKWTGVLNPAYNWYPCGR